MRQQAIGNRQQWGDPLADGGQPDRTNIDRRKTLNNN